MADVELRDLRVEYGATTALDGVSFDIAEGEFFTLVGPSGCGKTTTLRCLAGFEEPDAGSIAVGGEPMAGVPPEARGVGVVFQSYALFPHMTVGENVGYGLRFADPPAGTTRDERVAELLELVDLPGFADRDPATLSGGQQQRVALARALAPEPRLLLLDEPMSALDARLRERLRVQVRAIQRELDITTVYVTHDQEEALSVSDRVAVVDDGRVEQVGEPRELYGAPATRFVAEFLGDNNVLAGVVVAGDERGLGDGTGDDSFGDGPPGGDGRVAAADAEAADADTAGSAGTVAAAGALSLDTDAGRIPLPPDPDVGPGDRLTICVRPERVGVERADGEGAAPGAPADGGVRLPATVTSTEFLGDATRLRCERNGSDLVARTDGRRSFAAGERVRLVVDPADVHVVEVGR